MLPLKPLSRRKKGIILFREADFYPPYPEFQDAGGGYFQGNYGKIQGRLSANQSPSFDRSTGLTHLIF
jgi:hypothetical protein